MDQKYHQNVRKAGPPELSQLADELELMNQRLQDLRTQSAQQEVSHGMNSFKLKFREYLLHLPPTTRTKSAASDALLGFALKLIFPLLCRDQFSTGTLSMLSEMMWLWFTFSRIRTFSRVIVRTTAVLIRGLGRCWIFLLVSLSDIKTDFVWFHLVFRWIWDSGIKSKTSPFPTVGCSAHG